MSLLANFLRRWSTMDITQDNAILFEEHLLGVRVLLADEEQQEIAGLSRHTSRDEFARRYRARTESS